MDTQTNSTCRLANHRTSLKCVVDTLYGVIFHANQEA